MIDALVIKNFKAFKDETVVLGHHTMFIGTHASGKTTILEALNLFFNHALDRSDVRNKRKSVIIEVQIGGNHYKKVFTPPHFVIDTESSEGQWHRLEDYVYFYMPKTPYPLAYFANQCMSLHYTVHCTLDATENLPNLSVVEPMKGTLLSSYTEIKDYRSKQSLNPKETKKARARMLNIPSRKKVLLGIDEVEQSLRFRDYRDILSKLHQAFFVSKQKQFINDFPHALHPLYKSDIQKEIDTVTTPLERTRRKPFILVEGKTDVPWFENGLEILGRFKDYRVIPCGGYGNIEFVETQLKKANYRTLVITDGDMVSDGKYYRLSRDVIEMYTDIDYLNETMGTRFKKMPANKKEFFKHLGNSDESTKRKLASYAAHHLHEGHPFVLELRDIIEAYESNQPKYYK